MKYTTALLSLLATGVNSATVTEVTYTDAIDGSSLFGYLATPAGATEDEPRPAIIVLSNWDGVNEFEKERAEMFADDGNYVVMAAAVYNSEDPAMPDSFDKKMALAGKYRGDAELSASRVDAALAILRENPLVDSSRVAIAGYCLGGSLALNYALGGHDDIVAVAAFHGGLNSVIAGAGEDLVPVNSKVLILSGGKDGQDSTASIIAMEEVLNERNATWQITRYADVDHGFADHTGGAYNPYVGERSHDSFYQFVSEAFNETTYKADVPDPISVEEVKYSTDDGFAMTGYVAVPETTSEESVPAVIIIHDLSKPTLTDVGTYEPTRAHMLAELGYVGFAADLFGDNGGNNLTDMSQLYGYAKQLRVDDIDLANERVKAAMDTVKNLTLEGVKVDPDRIALIGYCLGGSVVINYATSGQKGVKGIVSYHGGLADGIAPVDGDIHAAMLIESGGDDDAGSSIEDLEKIMKSGNTKWEYSRYSGVEHAFTVWDDAQSRYNDRADVRSWNDTQTFLSDIFDGTLVVATDDGSDMNETDAVESPTSDAENTPSEGEETEEEVVTPEQESEPSSSVRLLASASMLATVLLSFGSSRM